MSTPKPPQHGEPQADVMEVVVGPAQQVQDSSSSAENLLVTSSSMIVSIPFRQK